MILIFNVLLIICNPDPQFLLIVRYFLYRFLQLGVDTVPVLVGPVSYLLLSKPAKGVEKSFSLLSLLNKILPIYK